MVIQTKEIHGRDHHGALIIMVLVNRESWRWFTEATQWVFFEYLRALRSLQLSSRHRSRASRGTLEPGYPWISPIAVEGLNHFDDTAEFNWRCNLTAVYFTGQTWLKGETHAISWNDLVAKIHMTFSHAAVRIRDFRTNYAGERMPIWSRNGERIPSTCVWFSLC